MAHGEVVSPGDFFSYEVVETRKGCGGSLVARQTLETEVQDSNLTSPTMILGRSTSSLALCKTAKCRMDKGDLSPLWQNKFFV